MKEKDEAAVPHVLGIRTLSSSTANKDKQYARQDYSSSDTCEHADFCTVT